MRLSLEQQKLVEDNLPLVRTVIKDKIHGVRNIGIFTYDDLYQIGCIGLCKAAYTDRYQYAVNRENSNSDNRAQFSTYAYRLILNEIITKLEYATIRRSEIVTEAGALSNLIENSSYNGLEEDINQVELKNALTSALLDAEERATGVASKGIRALFFSSQGYTSTEIANVMGGISCHNVTAWISKARKFLKEDSNFLAFMSSAHITY